MEKFHRFEDCEAWKKAREFSHLIYTATRNELFSRDYSLKDQIRRAVVSAMSNIAEGFERRGDKELRYFLSIAKGSAGEVRAQLYVALDEHYITQEEFDVLYAKSLDVSRLISGLISYIDNKHSKVWVTTQNVIAFLSLAFCS